MTGSPDRIYEIFTHARSLPEAERDGYVTQACQGNEPLLIEVKSLLKRDTPSRIARLLTVGRTSPITLAERFIRDTEDETKALAAVGFEVLRKLGSGGGGTVLLARQRTPNREVAIKVLSGLATDAAMQRFELEAHALGRLNHPSIAEVFQWGVAGTDVRPVPFIAMEVVPNARPLTEALAPRELNERLRTFLEVCDAVSHAHARGIIHRDLKPGNILMGDDGGPKVVDFGIARVLDETGQIAASHTLQGTIVGSPPHMSPEQAAGSRDIDVRADVYSLGTVLYELVSGVPAFDFGTTSLDEATQRVKTGDFAPLRKIRPGIDEDLALVVQTAMATDRSERYRTVHDFAADVRSVLECRPIRARPATLWYRATKAFRRQPRTIIGALAGTVAALATIVTIALLWQSRRDAQHASLEAQREPMANNMAYNEALRAFVQETVEGDDTPSRVRFARREQPSTILAELTPLERPTHGGRYLYFQQTDISGQRSGGPLAFLANGRVTRQFDGLLLPPQAFGTYVADQRPFVVTSAAVADVFTDHAGRELVASLSDTSGLATNRFAIAVLDFEFNPLQVVWSSRQMVAYPSGWHAGSRTMLVLCDQGALPRYAPEFAPFEFADCPRGGNSDPSVLAAITPHMGHSAVYTLRHSPHNDPTPPDEHRTTFAWMVAPPPPQRNGDTRERFRFENASAIDGPGAASWRVQVSQFQINRYGEKRLSSSVLWEFLLDNRGQTIGTPRIVEPQSHLPVSPAPALVMVDFARVVRGKDLAEPLCERGLTAEEVRAELSRDGSLSALDVEAAVDVARAMLSNCRWLCNAAAEIAAPPKTKKDQQGVEQNAEPNHSYTQADFERAVRWAREGVRLHREGCLNPDECAAGRYFELYLGQSYFRAGKYDAALKQLERTSQIWAKDNPRQPYDLMAELYIAMTLHKLGRHHEARAKLVECRSVIRDDLRSGLHADCADAQAEADALIR